jgi:hypothetical protein
MAYVYIGIIVLFLAGIIAVAMTMDKEDIEE